MNEKLTVKPLRDQVVIERKQQCMTKGGLVLPESSEEVFQIYVVAIGPLVQDVGPGDMVQLGSQGDIVWVNGSEEKLAIVSEGQILAKLSFIPDLSVV